MRMRRTMQMDDALRACYGVLLGIAVLSPSVTFTRVVLTLPMCFILVYVGAQLSFHSLCQINSDLFEDTGSNNDVDGNGPVLAALEDDNDDDEQDLQPDVKYMVCAALLGLFAGPPILSTLFTIDHGDAFIGNALVLLGLYCLVGAFGPFMLYALRRVTDGRLTKQQLKLRVWGGTEWSWLWVAMCVIALVISIATVCTKHTILKHLFGFAVTIKAIDTISHSFTNFLVLPLLPLMMDANKSTGMTKKLNDALTDVITFKLPLEADKDANKEHGVIINLGDVLVAGLFIAVMLHKDFWEARTRGERAGTEPFEKSMFRLSLIFYVVGFVVGEVVANMSGISQRSPGYAMMASMAAVVYKIVERGDVGAGYELIRQLFSGSTNDGAGVERDVGLSTEANVDRKGK